MKKIIIVSSFFAPMNAIASIRPTKIAKYLSINHGYNITVITSEFNQDILDTQSYADMKHVSSIINVANSKSLIFFKNLIRKRKKMKDDVIIKNSNEIVNKNFFKNIKKNLTKTLEQIVALMVQLDYYRNVRKKINRINLDYEVIFSTYGPYSSHYIGRYLKRKNKKSLWIADFRDPVYNPLFTSFLFKNFEKKFAKTVCRDADLIVTVSDGMYQGLFFAKNSHKHITIHNGFDKEDIVNLQKIKENKLTFCYVGDLYGGKRDLTILFDALSSLCDSEIVKLENVKVVYAGVSSQEFLFQLSKYPKISNVIDYGFVERKTALQLELSSHILLLPSWNTNTYQGVIPGKFLEYIMAEKPIIGLINGEKCNSELRELIETSNVGFVYEEAKKDIDYDNLKKYIEKQYKLFSMGKELFYNPNIGFIDKFDYKNIAKVLHLFINNFFDIGKKT